MNDFITIIEDLIHLFQELIQIEQTKLEAVKNNRITYVEDCMNKEQAAIMKLRGLDKKREICQDKLGYKDYTFQQILSELPDPEDNPLKKLFDTLSRQIKQFQSVNESARSVIEINLHMIDKTLKNSQNGIVSDKAQWEGLL